ncbi:hypothetical protein FCL40_05860 [Ferrimonas sediminicola]|uniref:Uncharacterized protein n=1 Tax=Ferrimonas sediminicola TaxID=2569538 RepID=A0A4U1BHE9_9GAMM|nr:hypothetical protein [Ferrimonas sediminicola]TKB50671.1 hypothetical protein FCL40_05860 [Ferrimonas sediminicola]
MPEIEHSDLTVDTPMDTVSLQDALNDVRKAQRLLVAYHQRVMPIIDTLARSLGCRFHYWQPTHHNPPSHGAIEPFGQWAWDFSPLNDASFLFLTEEAEQGECEGPDAWLLVVRLVTDSGFDHCIRRERVHWDATQIEPQPHASQTRLDLHAYRLIKPVSEEEGVVWWQLFNDEPLPEAWDQGVEMESGALCISHSVLLNELGDAGGIRRTLDSFQNLLLAHGFATSMM